MGVLGSVFGGTFLSTRGGNEQQKKEQGPPVSASSKDEEQFIQCVNISSLYVADANKLCRDFLKSADGGEQKAQQ